MQTNRCLRVLMLYLEKSDDMLLLQLWYMMLQVATHEKERQRKRQTDRKTQIDRERVRERNKIISEKMLW